MSFAWLDYLTLAEALLQARTTFAPEEACCRAAISRAYYAVYGAAHMRAREQDGLQLPTTGDADRKSTRLNSSHIQKSRMPSSA